MSSISFFRIAESVITGSGSVSEVGEQAKRLNTQKALIVTDQVIHQNGLIKKVADPLGKAGIKYDVLDRVTPEPPFELLEELAQSISDQGYDLLVGVGGGSVLDVTKVLAIMMNNPEDVRSFVGTDMVPRPGIPIILIPSTSGTGSEVTSIAVFTDSRDNVKKGIVSHYLLPKVSIVDAEMTLTVPPKVTASTGLDALVHAVESYTAKRACELTDGIAIHAIKLISGSLRQAVYNGNDLRAREDMAMGSLMAGISLGNAGVGAVHALAYPLGGKFKVPHGVANALLLPFVMKYNMLSNITKFAKIAEFLGENIEGLTLREAADRAVRAMGVLARDIGIPQSLREVGVKEEDIPQLAEDASKIDRLMNNNPRWLTVKDIEAIYWDAFGIRESKVC